MYRGLLMLAWIFWSSSQGTLRIQGARGAPHGPEYGPVHGPGHGPEHGPEHGLARQDSTCFHGCDAHHDLASCVLDPHSWRCSDHQFCEVTVGEHNGDLAMYCRDRSHDLQDCRASYYHNQDNCGGPSNPGIHLGVHDNCVYCCADRQCVNDVIISQPSLMSEPHHPGPAEDHPHGHQHSCYSSPCNHGDDLAACTAGQFSCASDDFCDIHIHIGTVEMKCKHRSHHDLKACEDRQRHNGASCVRYSPDDDCSYCCSDHSCVDQLLTSLASTATDTAVAAPRRDSCFTTACRHHDDLATCIYGRWVCEHDEFCKLEIHKHGEVSMHCQNISSEFDHCNTEQTYDQAACDPLTFPLNTECRFCCHRPACIYSIAAASTSTAPVQASTIATMAGTTTPPPMATTLKPTTPAATDCHDLYYGDCRRDFPGRCAEPAIRTICPLTCGVCTPVCIDLFLGDCAVDFAGQCNNPTVAHVCRKTCNACAGVSSSAGTTIPGATHAAWQCKDHYIHGNCSVDFAGLCWDPVIRAVCQDTCGECNTSASQPSTASSTSPAPTTPSAGPSTASSTSPAPTTPSAGPSTTSSTSPAPITPPARPECIQCGNYDNGIACTDVELNQAVSSPCDDTKTSFCMTDVIVDSNSKVLTYKRCVTTETCANEWYLRTSDKPICLAFDPLAVPPDLSCHYCCVGDGCNTGLVPDCNALWRP